ncbi:MAG TPA: DinB family protein [Phototrophicaceae bacterium]|nr:DinB family protein [Phototrophicaceae bacterium]
MIDSAMAVGLFERSYSYVKQQTAGITHEESLIQPPFHSNCINWVMGHILASRCGLMVALGIEPIWPEEKRVIYQRGSEPITDANQDTAVKFEDMLRDYDQSQEQIVACLKTKSAADFEGPSDRPNLTLGERMAYGAWHEGYHVGNIDILRQMVGKNDNII